MSSERAATMHVLNEIPACPALFWRVTMEYINGSRWRNTSEDG